MKIKQKISMVLYFAVSLLLISGVIVLGDRFLDDNTVPIAEKLETSADTEPESIVTVMQPETDAEIAPIVTEPQEIVQDNTEETETQELQELQDESETVPTDPKERLVWLFGEKAPLRWARAEDVETAETEESAETSESAESMKTTNTKEFVQVYPKLAYFYKDLTTGETVTYNADEIMYSASLIKAPYVYAILEEIDEFEKNKHDFDASGNALYDENGEPLFEGDHPNYDENGKLIYLEGEEKYNLDEIWTYDPATMYESGSGEIQYMPAGVEMTWRELIEYTLLYSDNIAFAQLRERFGYSSFYIKVEELGIKGVPTGFMNLSARDCALFLEEMYKYFETDTQNARMMKECMIKSQHTVMICVHYPQGTVAHKYGWDIGAFHDMAIIYDENPYLLVILTDYEDGGKNALSFIGDAVAVTKEIHNELHPETDESETDLAETN